MTTNIRQLHAETWAFASLAFAVIFNAAWASTPSVAFENQLGSPSQIMHSDIGPNGVVTLGSAAINHNPVKYGKGVRVGGDWSSGTRIVFPTNTLKGLGNKGTLSFWVRPDHDSNYPGIARWITADDPTNASGFQPSIYWRGWDQEILFHFCTKDYGCGPYPPSPEYGIGVKNTAFQFKAGDVFHVAIVWSRLGIAGTADTMRAYINGKLMGSTSPHWSENLTLVPIQIGAADYPQRATIDELTINRQPITNWATLPVK